MPRGRPLAKNGVDAEEVYVGRRAAACLAGVPWRQIVDWDRAGALQLAVRMKALGGGRWTGLYRLSEVLALAARERIVKRGATG